VASPSPFSYTYDGMRRLAAGGVGAIVMYSLFEEQVREQQAHIAKLVDGPAESFPEALDYVPLVAKEDAATHAYLSLVERAAATLDVPVIASLNGLLLGRGSRAGSEARWRRSSLSRTTMAGGSPPLA
jgi:dihydroorotate dehydrogenase (fumarate)